VLHLLDYISTAAKSEYAKNYINIKYVLEKR